MGKHADTQSAELPPDLIEMITETYRLIGRFMSARLLEAWLCTQPENVIQM